MTRASLLLMLSWVFFWENPWNAMRTLNSTTLSFSKKSTLRGKDDEDGERAYALLGGHHSYSSLPVDYCSGGLQNTPPLVLELPHCPQTLTPGGKAVFIREMSGSACRVGAGSPWFSLFPLLPPNLWRLIFLPRTLPWDMSNPKLFLVLSFSTTNE